MEDNYVRTAGEFWKSDQSNALSRHNVKFMKHLPLARRGSACKNANRCQELEILYEEDCPYWSQIDAHRSKAAAEPARTKESTLRII